MRMPASDVDQGSASATPTASQSASHCKDARSKRDMVAGILLSLAVIRQALRGFRGFDQHHKEIRREMAPPNFYARACNKATDLIKAARNVG